MAKQGLSERALAQESRLSVGAIRSVGGTAGGPTLGTLLALARALDLDSIDQLLGPTATSLLANHDLLDESIGHGQLTLLLNADIG